MTKSVLSSEPGGKQSPTLPLPSRFGAKDGLSPEQRTYGLAVQTQGTPATQGARLPLPWVRALEKGTGPGEELDVGEVRAWPTWPGRLLCQCVFCEIVTGY